jgi:hypothetical protein
MRSNNYEIKLNPDFIHRKEIEEAIKENDGYCCCALEKNDDTKCICKDFREQNHFGFCHCGRYYKVLKTPKVCLCGSTRFKEIFFDIAKEFTLKGYIVTMPGVFVHRGDTIDEKDKERLDEIHKAKIADADEIFIVNKDGYIGESTKSEIEWAEELGKKITYLES